MIVYNTKSVSHIVEQIEKHRPSSKKGLVMFIGEHCTISIPLLIKRLQYLNCPFVGLIVPGVLDKDGVYDDAIIVKYFEFSQPPILVKNISNTPINLSTSPFSSSDTLLTFIDGYTERIGKILFDMYNNLSYDHSIVGSAVGSIESKNRKCIFTNDGYFEDAALIVPISASCKAIAKHGFQKAFGPLIATKTKGKTIQQLNWESALPIYKQAVEQLTGIYLSKEELFNISWAYPIGIYKEDSENIVRDISSSSNLDAINAHVEISDDTVLYVMNHSEQNLIQAAKNATQTSIAGIDKSRIEDFIVFDCISRYQILSEKFNQALKVIEESLHPSFDNFEGVLSLGEINSYDNSLFEFYNKTIVAASFYN